MNKLKAIWIVLAYWLFCANNIEWLFYNLLIPFAVVSLFLILMLWDDEE